MPPVLSLLSRRRSAQHQVLSSKIESVLLPEEDILAPGSVSVVAKRIDLLTAVFARNSTTLSYSQSSGHLASLLHYAVKDGNRECIRFLIERQLINKSIDVMNCRDVKYGGTPLHWVVTVEATEMLVEAGSDLNVKSETTSETPLHVALRYGRTGVAETLIRLGCELNDESIQEPSKTALQLALDYNKVNPSLIAMLLAYGANPNIRNGQDETPRHLVATRIAVQGSGILSRYKEESRALRQVLSLLHSVGASRCPLNKQGCPTGCSAFGVYDGDPVDGYSATDLVSSTTSSYENFAIFDENSEVWKAEDVKVLCIDGNALHGILIIMILRQLEFILKRPIRDCFQVFSGSGTGGAISLYLSYKENGLIQAQQLLYFIRKKLRSESMSYNNVVMEKYLKRKFGSQVSLCSPCDTKVVIPCCDTGQIIRNFNLDSLNDTSFDGDDVDDGEVPASKHLYRAAINTGLVKEIFQSSYLKTRSINPSIDVLSELSEDGQTGRRSVFVSVGTTLVPVVGYTKSTAKTKADSGFHVDMTSSDSTDISKNESNSLRHAIFDPQQPVKHARSWCRDVSCTYIRIAPLITANLSADLLQQSENAEELVTRGLFELRVWLANRGTFMAKVAAAIM